MSFSKANQWIGDGIVCPGCHLKFVPPVKPKTDKSIPEKTRAYWDARFDVEVGSSVTVTDKWAHLANAARKRHVSRFGSLWRFSEDPASKSSFQTRIG